MHGLIRDQQESRDSAAIFDLPLLLDVWRGAAPSRYVPDTAASANTGTNE
jgi:hypothetical protein